jgi:O-antigen/teichoic acid export membrane protein
MRRVHEHAADRQLLLRGGLWSTFAVGVALATGPLLTAIFARAMTHREFGLLAVATAVCGPALALATLGLGPAVTQIAATRSASFGDVGVVDALRTGQRLAARALPWICLASAALVAAVHGVSSISAATVVVAVMLPGVIAAPITSTYDGILRAASQPRWASGASAVGSLAGAAVAIGVLLSGARTAIPVAAARTAGPVVGLVVLGVGVRRWSASRQPDTAASETLGGRQLLAFSRAMLLTSFGSLLISQLDVFILGARNGPVSAGLYTPASRVADLGMAVAAAGGSLLLPALSRSISSGATDKSTYLYHWTSRWAFVASAPITALLLVTPGSLLHLVFGSSYAISATPARILGLGVLIQVVCGFNGLALEARGVPQLAAVRATLGIVASVVLCLILIPLYGAAGAAWATAAAIAVVNAGSSIALYTRFRVPPWDAAFMTTVAAFAVAAGLGWLAVRGLDNDLVRCVIVAALAAVGPGTAAWLAPGNDRPSGSVGADAADHGKSGTREDQQVQ